LVAASASTRGIDEGSSISASNKAEVTNRNTGQMNNLLFPVPLKVVLVMVVLVVPVPMVMAQDLV